MAVASQVVRAGITAAPPTGSRITDIDRQIAARLLAARKLAGLSQEETAAKLGVTFQQVQKYERGSNRASGGKLVLLAQAYGVSIAWLFGIEQDSGPNDDVGLQMLTLSHGADMARAFVAIESASDRKVIAELAQRLAQP